jgi:hypothetical protein
VAERGFTTQTSEQAIPRSEGGTAHRLTFVHGPAALDDLEVINLTAEGLLIGRDAGGGSWRLADPDVSGKHAQITYSADYGRHRLRDLGSKNGTFLDGRRIAEPEALENGSVIRVGRSLIVYECLEIDPRTEGLHDCPPGTSLARFRAEALADIGAPSDVSIVVLGPTGAGKEVLAKRIHEKSGRCGPLVSLNCATLSKELAADELFGHAKGAYTSAERERAGLFQTAAGGTLFLDEIAELPLEQQAVLLRVLEEKKVRPVGADVEIAVDVRLVCATHQDLARLESEGRFRQDLLARLEGLIIRVPPLVERRVEILSMFTSFLERPIPLSFDAAHALLLHSWPRNVRELQKAAKLVDLFAANAGRVEPWLLDSSIQRSLRDVEPSGAIVRPSKEKLAELLAKHLGNVTRVARDLGKERNQVYRWMEGYGLSAGDFRGSEP